MKEGIRVVMNGKKRREEILKILKEADAPISAFKLAETFNVSRQIIVADIALLRAAMNPIISTNKGYVLHKKDRKIRVFAVHHTNDQIEDELNTIVDAGGYVSDVFVKHKLYGELRAELNISSRLEVGEFVLNVKNGKVSPLKILTNEYHFHTVEAKSEEILDIIENELGKKKYLSHELNENA